MIDKVSGFIDKKGERKKGGAGEKGNRDVRIYSNEEVGDGRNK